MMSLLLAAAWFATLCARAEPAPALDRALDAELGRAAGSLFEPGYPVPYHVGLTALDLDSYEQRCDMGAPTTASTFRQRLILPVVRVGDYALDNHPVSSPSGFAAAPMSFEDDEVSLRHGLWLMLDGVYKSATADLLRKQALRVQRGKAEYDTDDLSKEAAQRREASQAASGWSAESLQRLCAAGSGALRRAPGLLEGSSSVRRRRVWSRLRDSEGFRVDHGFELAELELSAVDISTDGLRLYASRRYAAATPQGLPSESQVERDAAGMLEDLSALKVARTTSPFSAPALLDPSVSAAVVLAFGLRLSGEEQRDPGGAQIFRGKLGKPVLPAEFDLFDDPTRANFGATELIGRYDFDDQGIPPRRVSLIEGGRLAGFLLSRYPVIGFPKSNGHGRAYPGYHPVGVPGNLFLDSKHPLPEKRLLELLREECRRRHKPYGLWVKTLRHFVQQQGTSGHGSIRLMPEMLYLVDAETGALTLVRDLDLVGTPLDLMNNILRSGDDVSAQNISWNVPVSVVTGSLLLADAELQRAETKPEKHPILPAPEAVAPRARAPVPTFAVTPYLEVMRYRLAGVRGPMTPFVMRGLTAMRSHGEGDDTIVEAKLTGRSPADLGGTLRQMKDFIARLAKGGTVEETILSPMMTELAYRAQHGQGWPEDKP